MKMDTIVGCGWTTQPCARENGTALLVQVEGSTVWTVHLDVAGAFTKWALDIWALRVSLADFGIGPWACAWVKAHFDFWLIVFRNCP
jgi:hypothetical protein